MSGNSESWSQSSSGGNYGELRAALLAIREAHEKRETPHDILVLRIIDDALAAPPRNCDRFKSEYEADKLHEDFVKYCNACDCPMGCIHRRDTRCMLDTRCGSILKCFAEFVLSETKGESDEQK